MLLSKAQSGIADGTVCLQFCAPGGETAPFVKMVRPFPPHTGIQYIADFTPGKADCIPGTAATGCIPWL